MGHPVESSSQPAAALGHTPGPWAIRSHGEIEAPTPAGHPCVMPTVTVADVRDRRDEALIAAAPELLVALKGLLYIAETGITSLGSIRLARAALAKAEGESQ